MSDFAQYRLAWEPRLLSIVRIMTGLLFLEHGLAKILDFPHQPTHHAFVLFSLNPGLQGSLELVGGALLALGLFTRPVAFVLSGDMAVAYFMAHAPKSFFPLLNGGELAIVYCFIFLYFWLAGGGVWSLDWLRAPMQAHVGEIAREQIASDLWAVSRVPEAAQGRARPARPPARTPEPAEGGFDRTNRR